MTLIHCIPIFFTAPHDNIQPVIRTHDDSPMNSSFAKSSAEYLELLKRKYCV